MLPERVFEVIERSPERECIVLGNRRVTYGELGGKILAMADAIRESVEPGHRVALLIESSPEYVAACYGAWIAGAAVVGLNTALRADELARLVGHSGARCLVVDPAHAEAAGLLGLLGDAVPVIRTTPESPSAPNSGSRPSFRIAPEDLAAIIYTSGTTGHPKGVMLSHGNLAVNTESIASYLPIRPDDRALCVLPFQYSYGASILHTHLIRGASLIIERSFAYPHRVLKRIEDEGVTSFSGVPSTFYLLLLRTDLAAFDLSSLRYVTQAGGRMDDEQIRTFRTLVPSAEFIVMYGQTEASARLAYIPPSELDRKLGSAGTAIPGVELCVRDEQGRDLPAGEVGEVCARGENVMQGYWDDPDETDEVLRAGWLSTGDLGFLDEDGFLFLQGRAREMIKSGAHRIAPAEIEEVVRLLPEVTDVAVVGVPDDVLGEAVKAVVVASEPDEALRKRIMYECHQRLPRFKIPKTIEFRDSLPKTWSGKTRKHLL